MRSVRARARRSTVLGVPVDASGDIARDLRVAVPVLGQRLAETRETLLHGRGAALELRQSDVEVKAINEYLDEFGTRAPSALRDKAARIAARSPGVEQVA